MMFQNSRSVLALCIEGLLSLWFWTVLCQAQTAPDSCFVDQPDDSTLALADQSDSIAFSTTSQRQFVFPGMNFTCSGVIRNVNFVASGWKGNVAGVDPQIQLWNTSDNGATFQKVGSFDVNTALLDGLNGVSERKFYSYTVHPPLLFQPGYVLGVFSPRIQDSRLQIAFQNTGSMLNYRSEPTRNPEDMITFSSDSDLVPVLSVETEPDTNCDVGFSTLRDLQLASVITLKEEHIRIISGVSFGCDGEITNWTMAADMDTRGNRNDYPQLLIWRPTGNLQGVLSNTGIQTTLSVYSSSANVRSGSIDPPLRFIAGDVPGLYFPSSGNNVLSMFVLNGFEPLNYIFSGLDPTVSMIQIDNDTLRESALPLISLGIVYSTVVSSSTIQPTSTIGTNGMAPGTRTPATTPSDVIIVTPGTSVATFTSDVTTLSETPVATTTSDAITLSLTSAAVAAATFFSDVTTLSETPVATTTSDAITLSLTSAAAAATFTSESDVTTLSETPVDTLTSDAITLSPTSAAAATFTSDVTTLSFSETPVATTTSDLSTFSETPVATITSDMTMIQASTSPISPVLSPFVTTTPAVVSSLTPDASSSVFSPTSRQMPIFSSEINRVVSIKTVTLLLQSTEDINKQSIFSSSILFPTLTIPGNTFSVTSTVGISVGAVVGVLSLLLLIVLFVLVLRRKQRQYKLSGLTYSNEGVVNPVYSTTEEMVLDGGGVKAYELREWACAEVDRDKLSDTEEREFNNPLYSDSHMNESQFDNSLYSTPLPPSLSKSFYVPSPAQRENKMLQAADSDNILKEAVYSTTCLTKGNAYEFFAEESVYWRPSSQESELYDQLARRKYREIPVTQLKVYENIGSGQFGSVEKGVWNSPAGPKDVAVKSFKDSSTEEDKVKLLQEAAINGQFHHPSIITLYGVVTVGSKPMIVLELMGGDMEDFLPKLQTRIEKDECSVHNISAQCLDYSSQIASGMKYLSDKQFVHRDLAARNILMSQDQLQCKISDFGMARDLEESDYYVSQGGVIPVKWTAPEALNYKKYSPASDVWSFGALLYEIWSLGHEPFEGMTNPEVVRKITQGYRLPPPPGCPKAIYQLMIDCWHPESKSRPSFNDVTRYLNQSQSALLKWEDSDINQQATLLGDLLEAGFDLYPGLQKVYT